MSGYTRIAKECSRDQLHPQLSQAIRDYFQAHKLGIRESEIRLCCGTVLEKHLSGNLASLLDGDPDSTNHLALLLTDEWLIWARRGDRSGVGTCAARLKGMRLEVFRSNRAKDMVLEISAFMADSKEYVHSKLQLGPDPAAHKFCESVEQAVLRLNPPSKRTWLGLFGG
jgi:hypothetical protein